MLPGLTPLEVGRLRMSVGYGTHKAGRPLSPVEVGHLLERATNAGASLQDCATFLNFKGTSQPHRFLSVIELPPDIRHLVDWGRSHSSGVGFTTAVELARVQDDEDKRAIARAILEHGLQTDEVRQVAQIRKRSGMPVAACLKSVIDMRPTVEKRYVFIGTIDDKKVREGIGRLTQSERNSLLNECLKTLGLRASGRLGEQLFTLVGDEKLNSKLKEVGRNVVEERLRACVAEGAR